MLLSHVESPAYASPALPLVLGIYNQTCGELFFTFILIGYVFYLALLLLFPRIILTWGVKVVTRAWFSFSIISYCYISIFLVIIITKGF